MTEDSNTLAGTPSTESTSRTDGGLSPDSGLSPTDVPVAVSGACSDGEEASVGGLPPSDVGFPSVKPSSTECGVGAGPEILSETYRHCVARALVLVGRVVREIDGMRGVAANVKDAMERAACIEVANEICEVTETEISRIVKGEQE